MTDLGGDAKKSTANGDTRSGLRLRLRFAVPGRAADADPPQHLTCGKSTQDRWLPVSVASLADPQEERTLADHDQAEFIQAAECGQVRAAEGSLRHVEVFQMGGVGTSILGRTSKPTPGPTRQPPSNQRLHPQL